MAASYRPGANRFANDAAMRRLQTPQPQAQPAMPQQQPAPPGVPPPAQPMAPEQPEVMAPIPRGGGNISSFLPQQPQAAAPAQPPPWSGGGKVLMPPGMTSPPAAIARPKPAKPVRPTGNGAFDYFMRNNPQYRR